MSAERQAMAAASVQELLAKYPRTATVFEVVGIDACCGGLTSLAEAAALAAISVDEVIELLHGRTPAPAPAPAEPASLPEITRYIILHFHRRARSLLVELLELSRQVCSGHGDRAPQLYDVQDAVNQLVRELIPHMRAEERYHFRYIDSMQLPAPDREILVPLFGSIEYPLQSLRHDHSRDITAMSDLRAITDDFTAPAGSCDRVRRLHSLLATFADELRQHVEMEDGTLFPRAIEMERTLAGS